MSSRSDSGLAGLFGSAARARTLAALASASLPLTGYRIASLAAIQPIKAYSELKRLMSLGFVASRPIRKGTTGWVLADPDIRNLCLKRARLVWEPDWEQDVSRRAFKAKSILGVLGQIDLRRYRPNPAAVTNRSEFVRPRAKDRALRRAGLAPSRGPGAGR